MSEKRGEKRERGAAVECKCGMGTADTIVDTEEPENPWLPGWILTTTLVLSVLVLIWICCATMATAVDQYVPAEKLSISGDMDYMKEQKLTPYPASSLLIVTSTGREENEEEASSLPTKVNLEQSNI